LIARPTGIPGIPGIGGPPGGRAPGGIGTSGGIPGGPGGNWPGPGIAGGREPWPLGLDFGGLFGAGIFASALRPAYGGAGKAKVLEPRVAKQHHLGP